MKRSKIYRKAIQMVEEHGTKDYAPPWSSHKSDGLFSCTAILQAAQRSARAYWMYLWLFREDESKAGRWLHVQLGLEKPNGKALRRVNRETLLRMRLLMLDFATLIAEDEGD